MKIVAPIISIVIAQMAGVIGSIFTAESVETWYSTIEKPFWNPPNWVFGPVWTLLYVFMGIAAYLIWRNREKSGAKLALVFYGVQLFLNTLWSILFFGLQNPSLAFIEIVILLVFILITIILFWRISRLAALLLVPYIAWVFFATVLNFSIMQLN